MQRHLIKSSLMITKALNKARGMNGWNHCFEVADLVGLS
ncbi:hypothetical protein EV13_2017 [Prochlorococcus sp. MIT 0702]|nr:hypothetical protein EV13_2017 [Prochlorococcus sp. MIT 0702]